MKKNLTIDSKQNPRLCQRELSDGRISLYLEYYLGRSEEPVLDELGEPIYYADGKRQKYKVVHIRKKESLGIFLVSNPKNTDERRTNKENIELAQEIRRQREQEFRAGKLGYRLRIKGINFLDFLNEYEEQYQKTDKRAITATINRFKAFLTDSYSYLDKVITPDKITPEMCEKFSDYLLARGSGEGPHSYFKRWKKIINVAVKKGLLDSNPCKDIRCGVVEDTIKKDILSQEEVTKLLSVNYPTLNQEIRRAFAFSLYAGLRFCDVRDLKYSDIDYSNKILVFKQNKTEGHSKSATVIIPLNDSLISLLGNPEGNLTNKVFLLPTHTACLKNLKVWCKKAEIDKHITWHCARHSFAVNILTNGANIKVVQELLGHASLKNTEKYVRAIDSAKKNAIDSPSELPTIK